MKIRIAGRICESIVDGPGLRYVLFTQGCPRSCLGCHNPQTHDLKGGIEVTTEKILEEISSNPLLSGVTFSGGEPFIQANALIELARKIKHRDLNLVIYTGYTWEELHEVNNKDWNTLLEEADVLVDGPFIQKLHSWNLKFTGSSNQRIIDIRRSLVSGKPIELASLDHIPNNNEKYCRGDYNDGVIRR